MQEVLLGDFCGVEDELGGAASVARGQQGLVGPRASVPGLMGGRAAAVTAGGALNAGLAVAGSCKARRASKICCWPASRQTGATREAQGELGVPQEWEWIWRGRC